MLLGGCFLQSNLATVAKKIGRRKSFYCYIMNPRENAYCIGWKHWRLVFGLVYFRFSQKVTVETNFWCHIFEEISMGPFLEFQKCITWCVKGRNCEWARRPFTEVMGNLTFTLFDATWRFSRLTHKPGMCLWVPRHLGPVSPSLIKLIAC